MTMGIFTGVRLPSCFEYDEAFLIQSNARRSTYSSPPNIISQQQKQPTKPPPFSADGPQRRRPKLHDLHPTNAETAESVSG